MTVEQISIKDRIERWGKRYAKASGIEETLQYLLKEKKMCQCHIAKKFDTTPAVIQYWVRKYKLSRGEGSFVKYVQRLGYATVGEFFTAPANVSKTFSELSDETGFSYVTISAHYRAFQENIK